jgi:hypothetical protein
MKTTKKKFDAVAESRRWKEAVAHQTAGMTRAEVLAFFNRQRSLDALAGAGKTEPESCVVREEPPKP